MTAEMAVNKNSLLARLDPRVKVAAIFLFVAVISSMTSTAVLGVMASFMLALALASGITPGYLARRLLWALPFAGIMVVIFPFVTPGRAILELPLGLTASAEGAGHALMLGLRLFTALLAINILTASTGSREMTGALRGLGVPGVLVGIMEFTLRYIYVLSDEVQRMRTARSARGFNAGRSLVHWQTFSVLGQLVGVLFIRSWERGERIFTAMLSRGYDSGRRGEIFSAPSYRDICWGVSLVGVAVAMRIMESGVLEWQQLVLR